MNANDLVNISAKKRDKNINYIDLATKVLQTISESSGIPAEMLLRKPALHAHQYARKIAIWYLFKELNIPSVKVASIMNLDDGSGVLYHSKDMQKKRDYQPFLKIVNALNSKFKPSTNHGL